MGSAAVEIVAVELAYFVESGTGSLGMAVLAESKNSEDRHEILGGKLQDWIDCCSRHGLDLVGAFEEVDVYEISVRLVAGIAELVVDKGSRNNLIHHSKKWHADWTSRWQSAAALIAG